MQVLQAISEITSILKTKVSYADIGRALGVSRQYVNQIKYDELTDEQVAKIEDFFGIRLTSVKLTDGKVTDGNLTNVKSGGGQTVRLSYYPDVIASCGGGTYELSNEFITYELPLDTFPVSKNAQSYSMCHARGNSMYPRIWDGDFVICEHYDDMKIHNGEMYIFCYEDQIYLKRLSKNINQIVVESENPEFPTQYIEKDEMNNVHLIGHVICTGRLSSEKNLQKFVKF